ncbi:hypothetical protein TWF718_005080 [Orbilia javanica]|uniref:Clr5 domain-containing protein n=1 Tax=Orbilia javanica TaxID=47235 RepID=A0AAN8N9A3_9PEZI
MDLSTSHRVIKTRAPRCEALDNPEIRMEIEVLYTVNGLSLESIVEQVNKEYGLNATKSQYRDRLVKWGCRKRLNHREYQLVHKKVDARKRRGKESNILIKGVVEVSDAKLKRWESRNITFTDRILSNAHVYADDC